MGDNVNHFFDLCFCVCVVFVHLFEKVTTEKKQKIPTQICVCVVFLCCSAAFFSEQGYPTPLSRFFLGEGVLCVWAAFELCFWASVQQKNTFRCHPMTKIPCSWTSSCSVRTRKSLPIVQKERLRSNFKTITSLAAGS